MYSNTGSEASTEPWFCEPCMAGVKSPHCEVCPRVGGIYKETDVGNWIHLVCALYIPQISFFDQDRITKATLFELNYQVYLILESCCNLSSLCTSTALGQAALHAVQGCEAGKDGVVY